MFPAFIVIKLWRVAQQDMFELPAVELKYAAISYTIAKLQSRPYLIYVKSILNLYRSYALSYGLRFVGGEAIFQGIGCYGSAMLEL